MKIEGELASGYQVVDLSSMETLPGILLEADDQLGTAILVDKTGEKRSYSFGPHRMRITPKPHRSL